MTKDELKDLLYKVQREAFEAYKEVLLPKTQAGSITNEVLTMIVELCKKGRDLIDEN